MLHGVLWVHNQVLRSKHNPYGGWLQEDSEAASNRGMLVGRVQRQELGVGDERNEGGELRENGRVWGENERRDWGMNGNPGIEEGKI
ncbi:hypothetical protein ACH5RR_001079 [Cinchona calisaya]|uniref:Uncharacterized protein n=1 Tax=Cinchona calisaya TaxID=153742 RepID=A0ABD3B2I6_9GENT